MGDDIAMYSPDVLVSANTCKPISQTDLDKDMPTFWCATCQVDMKRPVIAIQHLIGRDHCAKVKSGKSPKEATTTATKRKKSDIGTVGYENIPVKKYKGPGPSSTSKSERKDYWRKGSSSTSKSERKDWRKYSYTGINSYRGGQGRGFGVQSSDRGLGRGLGRGYGRGFDYGGGYGSGYGGMGPQFPPMGPSSSGAPYPNNMPSGPHRSFAALESEVNFLRRQVSAFMGY